MPEAAIPNRSPRRGRRTLSRDDVLEGALQIVNEKGIEGLTFRALADHLRVTPMALYNHVSNKADLLNGVLDLVVRKADVTAHDSEHWQDWLFRTFVAMRDSMLARPGVLPLLGVTSVLGSDSLKVIEEVLAVLRHRAVLSDANAARAFYRLMSYTLGSVVIEGPPRALLRDSGTVQQLPRIMRASLEALPESDYPNLVETAPYVALTFEKDEFERGLRQIIEALARESV